MRKGSLYFGASDEFRFVDDSKTFTDNVCGQVFALNAPSRAHLAQQTSLRKNF